MKVNRSAGVKLFDSTVKKPYFSPVFFCIATITPALSAR